MLEYILVGLGVSAAWGIGIYAVMYVNKASVAVKDLDVRASVALRDLEARMHTRLSLLEAAVTAKPEVVPAAGHVAEWIKTIETLDPSSPKYEAYAARLAALGVKRDA